MSITAAEKAALLRVIDDIKYVLDTHIVSLSQLISDSAKGNNCVADEIGVARQRLTFWDQQRATVEREPTE
jgi:hypothetical protein